MSRGMCEDLLLLRRMPVCVLNWIVDIGKACFGKADFPHAYLCFQHGGSSGTERMNHRLGLQCPKCKETARGS